MENTESHLEQRILLLGVTYLRLQSGMINVSSRLQLRRRREELVGIRHHQVRSQSEQEDREWTETGPGRRSGREVERHRRFRLNHEVGGWDQGGGSRIGGGRGMGGGGGGAIRSKSAENAEIKPKSKPDLIPSRSTRALPSGERLMLSKIPATLYEGELS